MLLHRTLISLGCAFVILSGCARPAAGVLMNAFESPVPASTPTNRVPVTTVVVGPASTSLPLSQLKTATPYPVAHGGGTINMQNAESGVSLRVGERFLLDLGERGWKIRIGDESILMRDDEKSIPPGSQGYFVALKAGKTKIFATGDPPCRQQSPPCMLPTLFLEIDVSVLP